MAEQTVRPNFRRMVTATVVVFLSLVILAAWFWLKTSFVGASVFSGIALFTLILFLALFNTRKKIPFLPLMRAAVWLKWHQVFGYLSIVLFLVHIEFRLPNGLLETTLAVIFTIVAISGIVGLYLSSQLPKSMTRSGETVLFERIPRHREEIREGVRKLVLESEESCGSSTLSEFYFDHLRHYLEQSAGLFHSFSLEKRRTSYRLLKELDSRMRYLSDEEKVLAMELKEWIETKENLDFQEGSQRILKGWLFIHIPLTVCLIFLGMAHGIVALLYGGNS